MLLSGQIISDRSHIVFYIQIPFPDEPGRYESFTCNIEYRHDVTETNPSLGGYIVVRNYDGRMKLKKYTEGVLGREIDKLNSEDRTDQETWNFDTEEFSKYFYSKHSESENLSS